jgi:hypothetical protein
MPMLAHEAAIIKLDQRRGDAWFSLVEIVLNWSGIRRWARPEN